MKTTIIIGLITTGIIALTGCDSGSARRVANLERRIAELETRQAKAADDYAAFLFSMSTNYTRMAELAGADRSRYNLMRSDVDFLKSDVDLLRDSVLMLMTNATARVVYPVTPVRPVTRGPAR